MLKNNTIRIGAGFLLSLLFLSGGARVTFAQDRFVYDPGGKRDPFIPLVTADGRFQKIETDEAKKVDTQIKLEGIMYEQTGISYAIVNGLVVKVGDEVDGYRVLRINGNGVIFMQGDQTKEILLKKEGM